MRNGFIFIRPTSPQIQGDAQPAAAGKERGLSTAGEPMHQTLRRTLARSFVTVSPLLRGFLTCGDGALPQLQNGSRIIPNSDPLIRKIFKVLWHLYSSFPGTDRLESRDVVEQILLSEHLAFTECPAVKASIGACGNRRNPRMQWQVKKRVDDGG